MGIILSVLKIIGIILLVLLILLLVISALLLFVPFTYKGDGTYKDDKLILRLRVHYLFPLFSVQLRYSGEPYGKIRVFGIPVYDFISPAKPDNEKKGKKNKDKKNKDKKKHKKDNKQKREEIVRSSKDHIETKEKHESETENQLLTQKSFENELNKLDTVITDLDNPINKMNGSDLENIDNINKIQSFLDKIKIFWENLKDKYAKLIQLIKNIKKKTINLKKKFKKALTILLYYKEAFEQEETKLALQKTQKSIFSLLKKICPRKGLLHVHFGMEDPSVTGELCAFAGMIYPFIGKYVMIEPDFGQVILEADMNFKGHITLFTLLRAGWIYLFDKQIKHLKDIVQNANMR